MRGLWTAALAVPIAVSALSTSAQVGGKLIVGGNPTPGTEQPPPPNLGDRITLAGCLRAAPKSAGAAEAPDPNAPSDARFVLLNAATVDRVPPGTGGSATASAVTGTTFRLEGIDSQFSPFVDTKVEISGEVKPKADPGSTASAAPTVLVEFVQKTAATCK